MHRVMLGVKDIQICVQSLAHLVPQEVCHSRPAGPLQEGQAPHPLSTSLEQRLQLRLPCPLPSSSCSDPAIARSDTGESAGVSGLCSSSACGAGMSTAGDQYQVFVPPTKWTRSQLHRRQCKQAHQSHQSNLHHTGVCRRHALCSSDRSSLSQHPGDWSHMAGVARVQVSSNWEIAWEACGMTVIKQPKQQQCSRM